MVKKETVENWFLHVRVVIDFSTNIKPTGTKRHVFDKWHTVPDLRPIRFFTSLRVENKQLRTSFTKVQIWGYLHYSNIHHISHFLFKRIGNVVEIHVHIWLGQFLNASMSFYKNHRTNHFDSLWKSYNNHEILFLFLLPFFHKIWFPNISRYTKIYWHIFHYVLDILV